MSNIHKIANELSSDTVFEAECCICYTREECSSPTSVDAAKEFHKDGWRFVKRGQIIEEGKLTKQSIVDGLVCPECYKTITFE